MSKIEGFLSLNFGPTIEKIRLDNSAWFELLEDCNRLAMSVLPCLRPGTADNQKLLESAHFAKALQSIQAVVLLAERGMVGDARTVLRSCIETAIFQRKMQQDPSFADKLAERHEYHRVKIVNALLDDAASRAELTPAQVESMQAVVAEIQAKYPGRKLSDISLFNVATSVNGLALYNLIYRSASGDAAHTTLDSLVRHVVVDKNDDITGLRFGPQVEGLADTLSAAVSVVLHVLDSAVESFELTEFREGIAGCLGRWKGMT